MSCIIISETRKVNKNIWERIKFLNLNDSIKKINENFKKYTLLELVDNFNIATSEEKKSANKGSGFFLDFNGTPYVITCDHVVGVKPLKIQALVNSIENKLELIDLEIIKRIPEIDIVILKFKNEEEMIRYNFYKINELETKLSDNILTEKIGDIFLNIFDYSPIVENNCIQKNIKVHNFSIEVGDFMYHIIPKIPILNFNCDSNELNYEKLNGYSGSLLVSKTDDSLKNPVGMLTSFTDGKLQALPICIILLFLKSVFSLSDKDRDMKKICGYNIPTEGGIYEENYEEIYGRHVIENTNIEYVVKEISREKNETGRKKIKNKFRFESGDFITEINGKKINDDGSIYSEEIGYNIPVDSFLMFELYKNNEEICNFVLLRDENNNVNKYNLKIYGKPLNELYNINIFNDHTYLYWNGFIFTEMSEELAYDIYYMYNLENIDVNMLDDFITNPKKSNGSKKYVCVINLENEKILRKHGNVFDIEKEKNTPFIKSLSKNKKFIILEKFSTKTINKLEDLENAIQKSCVENKNKIKMTFLNSNFENENNPLQITIDCKWL